MAVGERQKQQGRQERIDVDLAAAQFHALDVDTQHRALLEAIRARDSYRLLIEQLREKVAKLELGLIGPKSQRYKGEDDSQLSLALLAGLLGREVGAEADARALAEELSREIEAETASDEEIEPDADPAADKVHRRPRKPTGRRTGRNLDRVTFEVLPEEVKRLGTEAFERVGEETSTTIERRVASLVEVCVVRPKFRAKTDEAVTAIEEARADRGAVSDLSGRAPLAWFTVAPPVDLPLERGLAGPSLLANVAVRRFADHLPYHRLEDVYEREGMRFGRSTLYGWLDGLRPLLSPLIDAMRIDARASPYVCTDATGVLVQAPEKCSRGHFWVLVAPGKHVLFRFSHKHDSAAVDEILGDYEGVVVADAHSVYDHLFADGKATEAGCWGHARTYFFKTLGSEPEIAREFLANLRILFLLERRFADKPRKQRERMRATKIAPLVDRHFALCREHDEAALDATPLRRAITYSLNQEQALRRFLTNGRLPATNNISERELRRQATGRKNWLFVASQDGAEVNTTFTSLIASCQLHDIEPEAYLRDLLSLLPTWPRRRVLQLAPAYWKQTREHPGTQQILDECVIRTALDLYERAHSQAS